MKEKELSLNDLKETTVNGNEKLKEVDPIKLKGTKKKEEKNILVTDAFGALNSVTDRIKEEVEHFHEAKSEYEFEEELDKAENEDEFEDEVTEADKLDDFNEAENPKANVRVTNIDYNEEDFNLEDEEEKDEAEEQFNMMQKKLKETIKPITNKIDLQAFKISKKPVSVSNALKASSNRKTIIDWALFSGDRAISMTEFTGFEIDKLNPRNSSRNRLNTYKDIYTLIFNHIVDSNKPMTMEEWVKNIKFYDQNHLYFSIYKASFDKSNYIPYDCPHCKEVFVTEDISIDDMVKYKDEKAKEQAKAILESDSTTKSNEYDVDLLQISDNYVFGFKDPTIYNVIFENISLDEKFLVKYADLLEMISYIDEIYLIDYETSELRPIELKTFPNDMVKTTKYKIDRYAKIIQSLKTDEYNQLDSILRGRDKKHDMVSYVLPKVTCPKCKKEIEERPMSAEDLLFTRHQLARIANI